MMQNAMTFKGYHGSVEISPEDNILFGQVLFISPLINYEAETAKELEQAFQEVVFRNLCHFSIIKEKGMTHE
ncbi:DNA repair protein [Shewanella morhuae]|uniref:Uncharacterized protein encoded in hypervariable junctions of pilus gene clusters n=1 Tax=Shewanella morhuae TaxID=365591 RepID=A0A380C006_9GAMM|nr:DNA repair protein [Shewanella morhuae]SUJ09270.1 Uncharacterized protein encoded in hypervariable junctions of pilus gene clusters [Shewanella morhuae]